MGVKGNCGEYKDAQSDCPKKSSNLDGSRDCYHLGYRIVLPSHKVYEIAM
jgi:hypothetical protein